MFRLIRFFISLTVIFGFLSLAFASEENLTITTYYPSPNGSFRNLAVSNTFSAPNIVLQIVYKTWTTVLSNAVAYTYADVTDSDLAITAKRTGSIFKITVIGQGYQSGACCNIGIKYVGTNTLIAGVAGSSGEAWAGSGNNGAAANSWTITRVTFHNPGTVAGTSYTYRAMLGLWSAGTAYLNYAGSPISSMIMIEELGQ